MASSKSRKIPSNKECKVGANLAIENAERHYRCAVHLSEISEFGPAQSHLILGVEEAIKAYSLYLKGLGMRVRQKELNKLLYDHRSRHSMFRILYLVISLVMWTLDAWISGIKTTKGKPEHEVRKIRKQTVQEIVEDLRKSAKSKKSNTELSRLILPIMTWWETLDERKKAGFYVDPHNGDWSTPTLITKKEYLQSLRIAQDVIENAKGFLQYVEALPEEERSKMIVEIKQQYKKFSKVGKAQRNNKRSI